MHDAGQLVLASDCGRRETGMQPEDDVGGEGCRDGALAMVLITEIVQIIAKIGIVHAWLFPNASGPQRLRRMDCGGRTCTLSLVSPNCLTP